MARHGPGEVPVGANAPYPIICDEKDETTLPVSSLAADLSCPVCLGILKNAVTTKCLHRFCHDCIEKCLRQGKKECPSCRRHVATRRSLRPDANFDRLIATILPDLEGFELEQYSCLDNYGELEKRRLAHEEQLHKQAKQLAARSRHELEEYEREHATSTQYCTVPGGSLADRERPTNLDRVVDLARAMPSTASPSTAAVRGARPAGLRDSSRATVLRARRAARERPAGGRPTRVSGGAAVVLRGIGAKRRALNGVRARVVAAHQPGGWATVRVHGELVRWRSGHWSVEAAAPAAAPATAQSAAPATAEVAPPAAAEAPALAAAEVAPPAGATLLSLSTKLLALVLALCDSPTAAVRATGACTQLRRAGLQPCAWPIADFFAVHSADGLHFLLHLGRVRARIQHLRIRFGKAEAGLLGWLLERCELGGLRRAELVLHGAPQLQICGRASAAVGMSSWAEPVCLDGVSDIRRGCMRGYIDLPEPGMPPAVAAASRFARLCGPHAVRMLTLCARPPSLLADLASRAPVLCELDICGVAGMEVFAADAQAVHALSTLQQLHRLRITNCRGAVWKAKSPIADRVSFEIVSLLEESLPHLPRLRTLELSFESDEPVTIRSPSLELLDCTSLGKGTYVGPVHCPRLQTILLGEESMWSSGLLPCVKVISYPHAPGAGDESEYVACGYFTAFSSGGRLWPPHRAPDGWGRPDFGPDHCDHPVLIKCGERVVVDALTGESLWAHLGDVAEKGLLRVVPVVPPPGCRVTHATQPVSPTAPTDDSYSYW